MRRVFGYLLFFSILFVVSVTCAGGKIKSPQAVAGVLDLTAWDFAKAGSVDLDGQWEFFWGRLLSPGDFRTGVPPPETGYFSIPGYWNGHRTGGVSLPGDGCATFRLKIRLKSGKTELALRVEDQATAYRLWVNGSVVMENGIVADNADAARPYYKIMTAALPAGAENLDCILQVSNFHLAAGGPYRKITLGTAETIRKEQNGLFAMDLLLFGMLGVIGVYHLVFYLLRRKDLSLLYFGIFCLSWCAGIPFGATGGRFITLIFPDFPWYWVSRMELLTWFPTVPLFLMFFASLFPKEFYAKIMRFSQVVAIAFFLFVLFAPSRVVGITEVPYQIFSMAIAVSICLSLYRAVRNRRSEAGLMLMGFLFFLGTVVNDILFMNMVIYSVYVISVGIAVMILIQSFALSRRFARSFASVEVLTDELEKKNIALSRIDRLKDEFLANTSHELRTPLNGIIGIAESLVSGISGLPEKVRENLAMIIASGKRLAGLINDILDLSRLKNRDIQLRRQPVDIRALTESVLTVMRPLAAGKPLALHNHIPEGLPPVRGDEDRLQQILYNLIGNAVKFTDHGEIGVSAKEKGDLIEVSVADTGIGIPEGRQEDIFRPFEQADASDDRTYGGAGLGLSITRQLVELHGGSIAVKSAPNEGAVFSFDLPVVRDTDTKVLEPVSHEKPTVNVPPIVLSATHAPTITLSGFTKPVQILAIDDDPINLQVIINHMAFKNVTVIGSANGGQGIGMIEEGLLPDLVLLDIMMPRMTGYQVCRWLRQRYTSSEMPVIMLTAKSGTEDIVQGFAEGANDYLVKPFSKDELISRVVSQLRLKQSYLTLRENLSLTRELAERRHSEQELRLIQRQLSSMLDSIDDALLAVNESLEIGFCNRLSEQWLGYGADDLLGRPLLEIVRQASGVQSPQTILEAIRQCFAGKTGQNSGLMSLQRSDQTACPVLVYLSLLDMEEEPVCLLILRKDSAQPKGHPPSRDTVRSLGVIEAMNQNRARLQSIKNSLNGLLPFIDRSCPEFSKELDEIDSALNQVGLSMLEGESYESRRHLAVEVMTCSLEYWTQCTGLSKADLARQSRLWKVYTNLDGWDRTQTLDRYLNIATFPLRPQWLKVLKTAEFALAVGTLSSPIRTRLEVLLTKLRVQK